jgi:geranylgeranyl pyrophosphate synthase
MTGQPRTPSAFAADATRVENAAVQLLVAEAGATRTPVHEAMRYAVAGPAKRLRPVLGLRLARGLGSEREHTLRAVVAVELIHCASLVLDDLPCMDDCSTRRGRTSAHLVFGEATAILASLSLVTVAMRSLVPERALGDDRARLVAFQREALAVVHRDGLADGQWLDLSRRPCGRRERRIAALKTASLFRLAARAGALYADEPPPRRRDILGIGTDLGHALQAADDAADGERADPRAFARAMASVRRRVERLGGLRGALQDVLAMLNDAAPPPQLRRRTA